MSIRTLIIDHDPGVVELLGQLLRSQGFDVVTAATGEEGLRLGRDFEPGIVILDLLLPDRDGWDMCMALRAFSDVPILALSAIDDPHVVASILDAGADDHLVKPVSSSVLVAHVHKLARRPHTAPGPRPWLHTPPQRPTAPLRA